MGAGTTSLPIATRGPAATAGEGALLARRVARRIGSAQILASFWGAIDVFALLWLVLPAPAADADSTRLFVVNAAVFAACMPVAALVGRRWAGRIFAPALAWLREERPATPQERSAVLCLPLRSAGIDAAGWGLAALLFFLVNAPASLALGLHVATTILLGGITCVALGYLLSERILRPVTTLALADGGEVAPAEKPMPGVAGRLVLTWLFATGVPLLGLVILGVQVLVSPQDATLEQMARSVVVVALGGAAIGLAGMVLAARSVADPLTTLRRALGRIEAGDLAATVAVDDASEVGRLQAGFNRMATGLRERERLQDLFGRHVGEEVAQRALDGDGIRLGGEVRDVAVLFVDLIGSTALAARRPPRDVVRLLNEFFAVVVDVVGRHGGWVNKFEGDAALAVFGAPVDHPDPAGAALAAARDLRRRLHALPGIDAGIGVSAGPAVAGNVGAEHRFEYTVIGDPVNEAARLCELAKRHDGRLLASHAAVAAGAGEEARRWARDEDVVLRGRRRPTAIAVPVPVPATAAGAS